MENVLESPPRERTRSPSPMRSRSRSPLRSRSPIPRSRVEDDEADRRPVLRSEKPPVTAKPSRVLGVFGLHGSTRERELEKVFCEFGPITECRVILDKMTGNSKCFAFISFENVETATKALDATNGMDLDGRPIRVDYSKTERPHTPTPGRYMGERLSRDRYEGSGRRGDSYSRPDSYRDDRYAGRDRRDYRRDDRGGRQEDYRRDDRREFDRRPDYERRPDYDRRPDDRARSPPPRPYYR